jgi:hypothetical protein
MRWPLIMWPLMIKFLVVKEEEGDQAAWKDVREERIFFMIIILIGKAIVIFNAFESTVAFPGNRKF